MRRSTSVVDILRRSSKGKDAFSADECATSQYRSLASPSAITAAVSSLVESSLTISSAGAPQTTTLRSSSFKEPSDVVFGLVSARLLEDHGGPYGLAALELGGLAINGIQDLANFAVPECAVLPRLDLNPDPAAGYLKHAILQPFRHEKTRRLNSGPLPDENQRANQVLVMIPSATPCSGTRLLPSFQAGRHLNR